MRKLLLLGSLFLIGSVKSQSNIEIKEQYDYTHSKALYNGTYSGVLSYIESTSPLNQYAYGEQLGFALESHINMYKTTGDKAYLIKFINQSLIIISWRNTNYKFNSYLYMDGVLLWAMAHFCNLVLYQEPALSNFILPNSVLNIPTSTFAPNILPSQSFYTFGYIANWLIQKQVETFDVIINDHWMSDQLGFKGDVTDNYPMGINMQAGFGGALLYLGQLSSNLPSYSGLASYLDKGAALARLYKTTFDLRDNCSCQTFPNSLLQITSNNSYWWYHSGWRIEQNSDACASTCFPFLHINQPKYEEYTRYIEDISHGVTTMILPYVAYELNLYTYNTYPFTITDMVRFRNMFTKNIFDGNLVSPGFHNAVNGADAPIYPPNYDNQFNVLKYSSLSYIPLYKFDGVDATATSPNVYDIVLNFFANEVHNNPTNVTAGMDLNGLAQVVDAQWDRECVNLTLYNRELVYNQDFIVKNNLIINPAASDNFHQSGDYSFAEPIINQDKFIINSNISSNFVSGEKIIGKPGFHAKHGSSVRAYIEPNLCTDGQIAPPGGGANNEPNYESWVAQANTKIIKQQEEHIAQTINNTSLNEQQNILLKQEFNIHPNPNNGTFTIYVQTLNEQEQLQLHVIDVYGKQLLAQQINNATNHQIDLSSYSKGIYYVSVTGSNGFREVKKVIVN
jgi:hypothetical protein